MLRFADIRCHQGGSITCSLLMQRKMLCLQDQDDGGPFLSKLGTPIISDSLPGYIRGDRVSPSNQKQKQTHPIDIVYISKCLYVYIHINTSLFTGSCIPCFVPTNAENESCASKGHNMAKKNVLANGFDAFRIDIFIKLGVFST